MGESLIDLVCQYPALWTNKIPNTKTAIIKMQSGGKLLKCWVFLKMMPSRNGNLYKIHMSGRKISKQKVVMA